VGGPSATPCIARRDLLGLGLTGFAALALPRFAAARTPSSSAASTGLGHELAGSEFVYISPFRSDGSESKCHGEVWYGWLDDAVVIVTSKTTWKARALQRGLDQARVWVGNHGRWKTWYGGRNEQFRSAPSFRAQAEFTREPELLERLMALYATKYPDEFDDWGPRQRAGIADGSRILIRYRSA